MRMIGILLVAIMLIAGSGQTALAVEGDWQFIFYNPNQDNKFICGDAVDDKHLIVFGSESDGQGGTSTALKKSSTGGTSWSNIDVGVEGAMFTFFSDIDMINENLAFAVGMAIGFTGPVAGPMFRIKNKGQVVEPLFVQDGPECGKIYCLDAEKCWVTCSGGQIIRTTDGGDNWQSSTAAGLGEDVLGGPIHFINANEGWATFYRDETTEATEEAPNGEYIVYSEGAVFKTTDGGVNWTQLVNGERFVYTDLQFTSPSIGYLAAHDGEKASLLKTTNGGADWYIQPMTQKYQGQFGEMPLAYIGGVHFFDDSRGWVVASYGSIDSGAMNILKFFYTDNGAMSWEEHNATDSEGTIINGLMYDMMFVDEHLGYAIGEWQVVVLFNDGEYNPPTDGDVSDGDATDGDGDPQDGDVDTGPVYHGAPGEPCPQPGHSETYDYPRCDPEQHSGLCAWKDGGEALCTEFCHNDADCFKVSPDACCKPVAFEGEEVRICLLDPTDCIDYRNQTWFGYSGTQLSEDCDDGANTCDKYHTDGCIPSVGYCSKACVVDPDCTTMFGDPGCCVLDGGDKKYCGYAAECGFEDGDTADGDTSDGDAGDGDVGDGDIADGDTGDGDIVNPETPSDDGGGSCQSTAAPFGILLAALMVMMIRRRRA